MIARFHKTNRGLVLAVSLLAGLALVTLTDAQVQTKPQRVKVSEPDAAKGVWVVRFEPVGDFSVAWRNERFTGGAWAAPAPGQVTEFFSVLRRPAGRIHLAGEHTDDLYPGYMEGAVRSGVRAAAEIERRR